MFTEKQILKDCKLLPFLGLLGFGGFFYFTTSDPKYIFFFSALSFFAHYPLYRTLKKGIDERTMVNYEKSAKFAAVVGLNGLCFIGYAPFLFSATTLTPAFFIITVTISLSCVMLGKVLSFYYYERK